MSFFEDEPQPATEQPQAGTPRRKRRSARALRFQRLALVLVALFVVVFLLALWIRSCAHNQKVDSYTTYFTSVQAAIDQSDGAGKMLRSIINNPTKYTKTSLLRRLDEAGRAQQSALDRVKKFTPPDSIKDEQTALMQAMTVRTNGMQQWRDLLMAQLKNNNADVRAKQLAGLGGYFTGPEASYGVLCFTPFKQALADEGITGVQVPTWDYFLSDNPFTVPKLAVMLNSMGQAPSLSGTHGVAITRVVAKPGGKVLVTGQDNTTEASTDLAFIVSVMNQGTSTERNVPVKLTLRPSGSSSPQKMDQTIATIEAGRTQQVSFSGFAIDGEALGRVSKITVTAGPVPKEKLKANNTARFRIILKLQ